MGNGTWSPKTYKRRAKKRKAAGTTAFDYSRTVMQSGKPRVHQTLNPYGLDKRESRDSAEHPESNAIIIALDETGSMTTVIQAIYRDLPQLHELLLGHQYIAHPQIMFAGFGDAMFDEAPLQIGQFESDNRMDENLENIVLEGDGGPYGMESYELMLFVAARHTAIDCWEKRNRKGYLFMIGDEKAYPAVKAAEVKKLLGYNPQANIPLAQIISEVKERYHLYFVLPVGASGGDSPQVLGFWQEHLGHQYVLRLENPEDVSETIALTIGLSEGAININDGIGHLQKIGATSRTVDTVASALASLPGGTPTVSGSDDILGDNGDDHKKKRTRRL